MTEKLREKINSPVMDQIVRGVVLLVIPWSIWVTQSIYASLAFQQRGDRFSSEDGHRLEKVILEESEKNRALLFAFERQFSSEFVRHSELKTVLEGMKK
mgnify:FL=1